MHRHTLPEEAHTRAERSHATTTAPPWLERSQPSRTKSRRGRSREKALAEHRQASWLRRHKRRCLHNSRNTGRREFEAYAARLREQYGDQVNEAALEKMRQNHERTVRRYERELEAIETVGRLVAKRLARVVRCSRPRFRTPAPRRPRIRTIRTVPTVTAEASESPPGPEPDVPRGRAPRAPQGKGVQR